MAGFKTDYGEYSVKQHLVRDKADYLKIILSHFKKKSPDMTTLVIKLKTKTERDFLTRLLRKMNIEVDQIEEPEPNDETLKAIEQVNKKKGTKVKNSNELFTKLGI